MSFKLNWFQTNTKGSPIDFNVAVDTSQVAIDIEKCKSVLINQICSFVVDTKDNGLYQQGNIKAIVTSNVEFSAMWVVYRPRDEGRNVDFLSG